MNIYFAGSIRGGRVDAGLYHRMIVYLQKTDRVPGFSEERKAAFGIMPRSGNQKIHVVPRGLPNRSASISCTAALTADLSSILFSVKYLA